jgi:hypothetical protein
MDQTDDQKEAAARDFIDRMTAAQPLAQALNEFLVARDAKQGETLLAIGLLLGAQVPGSDALHGMMHTIGASAGITLASKAQQEKKS